MNDDDIISIGKLRRPGKPGAAVSYDPTYGIRIVGEAVPPEADLAAAWVKRAGGWLRVLKGVKKGNPEIDYFLRAVRRREPVRQI